MLSILSRFSKDVKTVPSGIRLIAFVIFLRTLSWGFVDPFFPMYLSQFGQGYSLVGLLVSLIPIGALISIIPLMRLSDKMQDTSLIRDGEVVYFWVIVLYLLAGFFKKFELLALALLLNGVGQSLVVVGAEAYIRRHNLLGRAMPFGFYMALDYLGWTLGMVLGFFAIDAIGLNSMFLWIIPSIIGGLLILPHIHERGLKSLIVGCRKYFHSAADLKTMFTEIRGLSPLTLFLLSLAFFDGVIQMFSYIFIPLLVISMGLPIKSAALIMAAIYVPFVFGFFFSKLEENMDFMKVIALGLFVAAVSCFTLYFVVHQAWIISLVVMTSFSLAIIRPAYNGVINRITPHAILGEVAGVQQFSERIGRIAGPVLTGFLADRYGLPIAFLTVAMAASVLAVLSLVFHGYRTLAADPARIEGTPLKI